MSKELHTLETGMSEHEGIMTDPEELEASENPVLEEADPDAEEFDPLALEAADVSEDIVDDRDELDDVFGRWPEPAEGV